MSTGDWVTASTVIPFGFHGESKWRKVQQSFFVVNYRVCRTPERENDVLTPGTENLQTPLGALRALSHLRVLPSSLLVARSGTMWRKWRAIGGHVIIIGFDMCSLMLTSIDCAKEKWLSGLSNGKMEDCRDRLTKRRRRNKCRNSVQIQLDARVAAMMDFCSKGETKPVDFIAIYA